MDVFWNAWRRIELLLAAALIALSLVHVGQTMRAMATNSLSTDEFGTIGSFSAHGPWRVITDYRAPKNHVFFNLLNSLLPGRKSYDAARARALSLVAVALTAVAILAHAAWRGRWMAAAVLLALWSLAPQALPLSLEARGYGFLGFFGVASSLSALEYLRGKNRAWLWALAAATALGAYTLPSFLFFAGPLMLLVWLADRTRWSFFAGLGAVAATLLLYAPILKPLLAAFGGYDVQGENEADFRNLHGLLSAAKLYFFQAEDWQTWALLVVLALAPFAPLARREDRAGLRVVAGAVVVFCVAMLALRTPPIRTAAFVFLPLGIAGLWAIGDGLRARTPLRPLAWTAAGALLLVALFGAVRGFHFTPTENWTLAARGLEAAFPSDMRLDFQRYAKYFKQTLPDADARSADYDPATFASGRLVVADAGNKWAEGSRFAPPAGMDRVVQWTVPGTIRNIVLTFRLPTDSGLFHAPAPLVDGRADTQVALQPRETVLHPAPGVEGQALVVLLDRPSSPHELTIEAGDGVRPVFAGNAVVIPHPPAAVRLHAMPGSNLTATEAWITR
jgi:hypothetical protein